MLDLFLRNGYSVRSTMKVLTFFTRTTLIVGVIAIGVFLTPQSARAQDVIGVSATGAEAQSGNLAVATNPFDVAGGFNAHATGGGTQQTGATALGADAFANTGSSTAVGVNSGPGAGGGFGYTALGANANFNGPGAFSIGIGSSDSNAFGVLSSGGESIA